MDGSMLLGPLKHFIKSKEDDKLSPNHRKRKQQQSKSPKTTHVSGSEVEQFYKSTVGKEAFEQNKQTPNPKNASNVVKKNRESSIKRFNINELMKAVESNDIKKVTSIIDSSKEHINSTDQYGWSPLMSACCAGNKPMVKLLLQWNPNLDLKDKSGNSCKSLAISNKHAEIVHILDSYVKKLNSPTSGECSKKQQESSEPTFFYCEICKQNIEKTSYKTHLVSLLHNFNSESKRKMPTMYGIPESNKGFQMLMRSGWDKETGLGPSGDGHKFPPKSVLKQDRTGLGARQYKARVTHTPEDVRREATPKHTFKKQLSTLKRRERRQERNLRTMLT